MRMHLAGIGLLIALAFALWFWWSPRWGLVYIHYTYGVVPMRVVCFWALIGIACVWLLIVAWMSIHRHS